MRRPSWHQLLEPRSAAASCCAHPSLHVSNVHAVCLFNAQLVHPAEPGVVALYEKLGYVADPDGIKGVAYQKGSAAGRALAAALRSGGTTAAAAR
jgi:hypothetical protein